jgi:hypothetical protein
MQVEYTAEVPGVLSHEVKPMRHGSSSNQDVCIADQLSCSIKVSVYVGGLFHDGIGKGKHNALAAAQFKGCDLTRGAFSFETTKDLVTSDYGKGKTLVDRQILSGSPEHVLISTLDDLRECIRVDQGRS